MCRTLQSFERHLRAENKRPETINHYVGASRQFLAFTQAENLPSLGGISRELVEMWLERLQRSYKPHSVRNRFVGLRIFFRWLLAEGEIERDRPASGRRGWIRWTGMSSRPRTFSASSRS